MLTIVLAATEDAEAAELQLEHSLVSLSKWEATYEKPFFGKDAKSEEETLTYVSNMLLTKNPPENFLKRLVVEDISSINGYINSKQSATWFREESSGRGSQEIVTAELIYYWMIQFNIPFSCENWHLNRLMTLIKICGIKQAKPRRMSRQAQAEQYRQLNAQRREQLGTTG